MLGAPEVRAGPLIVQDDDDFDDPSEQTAIFRSSDITGALQPAETPRTHVLVRMDGSDVGQVFTLSDKQVRIGRHPANELHIPDEGMSRRHARLVLQGDTYLVEDLDSANGTFVGGAQIKSRTLNDADVIQLGPRVVFRYSITDSGEEAMLRQLYEASVKDSLTGAYNREYLNERLKAEVAFSKRHKTELCLLLFDIDHFKKVNDTHGHQAGDAVLVALVETVQQALRTEDVLARYGGEEFAVTLRGVAIDGAEKAAERLRISIAQRLIMFDGRQIPVTASIGCASLADCSDSGVEALIAVADRRLYAAKRGGRNRVVASG